MKSTLLQIYTRLQGHFGTLHSAVARSAWWPIFGEDPPFEMTLGAILVQQTRWETVEEAILRLHNAGLLSPQALALARADIVATLIRPVAFYTQKAPGIIDLSNYIHIHYGGDIGALLARPISLLRQELLARPRIGPETADVILLYAGNHPIFVVDAYTRRLFERVDPFLNTVPTPTNTSQLPFNWLGAKYETVQQQIEVALMADTTMSAIEATETPNLRQSLYADYHALINEQCVRYCLTRPRCDGPPARRIYSCQLGRESYLERHDGCPLRTVCAFYQRQR